MPKPDETYIGDGVYASFDGYQIWLRTDRGAEGDHMIALDAGVYANLLKYGNRFPGFNES
jgi:hypothetical protein